MALAVIWGSRVLGSAVRYAVAALLGAATLAVLASGWLPAGLVALAWALSFILLLPRWPRLVAAFCAGAVVVMVAWSVSWSVGWGCASEVGGALVEHDCGHPPRQY